MKKSLLQMVASGVLGLLLGAPVAGRAADSTADYKITAQDVIVVEVFGEKDLSKELRVSQTGEITFPLLNNIKVAGMTAADVEKRIRDLLAEDYIISPQVNVMVKDYRRRTVSVLGEVNKAGVVDLPAEQAVTVPEAIAMAGGFTRYANQDKIQVTRPTESKPFSFKLKELQKDASDPKKAFYLQPGDSIYVPESAF